MKLSIIIGVNKCDRVLYRTLHYVFDFMSIHLKNDFELLVFSKERDKEYEQFLHYRFRNYLKIYHYANLGNSYMNSAVKHSHGELILNLLPGAFLSENFFYEILKLNNKGIIIPQHQFILRPLIEYTYRFSSDDPDFTISSLLWNNCFGQIFCTHRSLLNEFDFCVDQYSIWQFFSDSISKGVLVKTVVDSILFEEWEIQQDIQNMKEPLIKESALYELETLRKLIKNNSSVDVIDAPKPSEFLLLKGSLFYKILREVKKSLNNRKSSTTIPLCSSFFRNEWFKNALVTINNYCPSLYYFTEESEIHINYVLFQEYYAQDFINISKRLGGDIDHLIFCPWMKLGGAEKVVLNLIKGLKKINKNANIVLISLRKTDNEQGWLSDLPSGVTYVDLYNEFHSSDQYVTRRFLATLLVAKKPLYIYNVGTSEILELFRSYGEYISENSRFCPFFFSSKKDNLNRYISFGISYIDYIYDYSYKIFSDNYRELNLLKDFYGLNNKMEVLYQPVNIYKKPRPDLGGNGIINILWASRLDEEKHPEILCEIASKTVNLPIKYFVYGKSISGNFNVENFKKYPNVFYMGGFSRGIQHIDTKNIDLFIYTSEYDGMPNVILEAISVGIPVLSSDVGGISELIADNYSGFLVKNFNDIYEYVEKIIYIQNNRNLLYKCALNAQKVLRDKHSEYIFENTLKNSLSL